MDEVPILDVGKRNGAGCSWCARQGYDRIARLIGAAVVRAERDITGRDRDGDLRNHHG